MSSHDEYESALEDISDAFYKGGIEAPKGYWEEGCAGFSIVEGYVAELEKRCASIDSLMEAVQDLFGENGKADEWCLCCGTPRHARKRIRIALSKIEGENNE